MQNEVGDVSVFRKWLIGHESLTTIDSLVKAFRKSTLSRVPGEFKNYYPWMDAYEEHKNTKLFVKHQVLGPLLIDSFILNEIESVYRENDNPLGLMLPEEKSFRISRFVSDENLQKYVDGFELFSSTGEYWRGLYSTLCQFIVPIYSTRQNVRTGGVGFSSLRARGTIFLSLPSDVNLNQIHLAINLAHELGHQTLMIFQGADSILKGELTRPLYSVIRKTMRPAINSFHAVVAAAFMLKFVSDILLGNRLLPAERIYCENYRGELIECLSQGIETCNQLQFTPIGQKLLCECKDLLKLNLRIVT